ncbi:RNA polymerase II-associated protein 3 [Selaginella moellendorffii]|uniref:RNA polymerase II-associated protein 3 n=1 Tax=Selaginella moellendorffii TaxID=88036 RepID=UPI000D1CA7E9|nr:RNA polymerase II-associated protein 3 [Selaginella moellendorffii]|eukprot:XP_002993680.2 RNA polymerase II-associated protein 3 [Selaginella moellendorffii]
MEAGKLREEGNALFKSGNYLKAAAVYTQAIKADPGNATLYSNRSAAFLNLLKVTKALADAETTVKLNPTWEKGYFRKGSALEAMDRYDDALAAYREALEQNPQSAEVTSKIKRLSQLIRDRKRAKEKLAKSNGTTTSSALEKIKTEFGDTDIEKKSYNFVKEVIESAMREWSENHGKLDPAVRFSVGNPPKPPAEEVATLVSISKAFESPDTLSSCVSFLRQYAVDTASECACVVVSKASIAYPQVWKGQGSRKWKHTQSDGFFVQLEAPSLRRAWFISSFVDKGQTICRDIESLDIDLHAVMAPLFR